MSIEYHLLIENASLDDVLNKIKDSFENSGLYKLSYSNSNSFGLSIDGSSSSWGADFEISYSDGRVVIEIHSGNSKKILSFIEKVLSDNNIFFEVEEV
ncbi:hypothetical protein [Serratia silvae]|uniref:Uncharacterized protein n=1 Tax=Serratia silvae TaxID=2824122 RepID=A0ABT0KEV9_9GAMM|nr:hypothetical protein [Serratia silvae]MCL1030543.1 hypothetical protein [Serratia silvae]